jgi:hypothetical protein
MLRMECDVAGTGPRRYTRTSHTVARARVAPRKKATERMLHRQPCDDHAKSGICSILLWLYASTENLKLENTSLPTI